MTQPSQQTEEPARDGPSKDESGHMYLSERQLLDAIREELESRWYEIGCFSRGPDEFAVRYIAGCVWGRLLEVTNERDAT